MDQGYVEQHRKILQGGTEYILSNNYTKEESVGQHHPF